MTPHTRKDQIIVAIQTFMDMLRPGDQIRSEDLVKAVKRQTGKYLYADTVLRYARQMRQDELINFTCIHKADRVFRIIPKGAKHSL